MTFEFSPIGTFHCEQKYRFETPRQGVFAENSGYILLNDDPALSDACRDLDGVDRIWIVFCFHLNESWKPFVHPPIAPEGRKISVFATRAPYRPNPIGISCVKFDRIEKQKIFVRNFDLLDNTPVLDIKPYSADIDSFPDARIAWLDQANAGRWNFEFSPSARIKMEWLRANGAPDMENFCSVQLVFDPFNAKRKRVERLADASYEIGCRTWKLRFTADEDSKLLRINDIRSNYSPDELLPESGDKYGDKEVHRAFLHSFPK